jgi:GH15 family glucan-1,4-alpha-glucosidase
MVGNFPQAFSHLTLILAARQIADAEARATAAAPGLTTA